MKNPPCKDCEKRELYCHSTCVEYMKYAKERAEMNKDKRCELFKDVMSPCLKPWYKHQIRKHKKLK